MEPITELGGKESQLRRADWRSLQDKLGVSADGQAGLDQASFLAVFQRKCKLLVLSSFCCLSQMKAAGDQECALGYSVPQYQEGARAQECGEGSNHHFLAPRVAVVCFRAARAALLT